MEKLIDTMSLKIAILATPARHAQEVADFMVKVGIQGVWNFTPVSLNVPDEVIV